MSRSLTVSLVQINPTVGAVSANLDRIAAAHARAAAAGADLVVTPELALSGYPPEDLVRRPAFLARIDAALLDLARRAAGGPPLIVGAPRPRAGDGIRACANVAVVLAEGRIAAEIDKAHLPNYGVFDEARVFFPGPLPLPVTIAGVRVGVMICEDMWYADVARHLKANGAEILVVPNGSPFETDKEGERLAHARARVAETGLPLLYVNQVGGQDELVFDGASFALDAAGEEALRLAAWREDEGMAVFREGEGGFSCAAAALAPEMESWESLYHALMVGLRDYIGKNRFPGVLLGLSGGIDSALAAALAVDALGPERVTCVMMPSPYTSRDSLDDAAAVAGFLGCRLHEVGIGPAMRAFADMLAPHFTGLPPNEAEENIQSRARGLALMALSNKLGPMVLATGNKSEMSVGYATLYGDMCGGFAVLKDVYKTEVFALCRWRNAHRPEGGLGPQGAVMPERVITKPPTAELKPDQKDEDSLPPYSRLDAILARLIEGEEAPEKVVAAGFDADEVKKVWRLLNVAEYKRRQSPPGVKTTRLAFGRDRRYPITNGFRD
ncbi:NAD+ synthase [Oleispirillum naphthae]|uniref:NAD+ synthase n=1 Tax=Oleispirillum naphthae TaxID=2838853 RepID=UPI0030826882